MDIKIVEHSEKKVEIIIKCLRVNDDIMRLKTHIKLFDKKIRAKKDGEWQFVDVFEVLYFESVDNVLFYIPKTM